MQVAGGSSRASAQRGPQRGAGGAAPARSALVSSRGVGWGRGGPPALPVPGRRRRRALGEAGWPAAPPSLQDLLRRGVLYYKGRLDLEGLEVVDLGDGKDRDLQGSVKHAFRLRRGPSGESLLLCARKPEQKQRWLQAFAREREQVRLDQETGASLGGPAHRGPGLLAVPQAQPAAGTAPCSPSLGVCAAAESPCVSAPRRGPAGLLGGCSHRTDAHPSALGGMDVGDPFPAQALGECRVEAPPARKAKASRAPPLSPHPVHTPRGLHSGARGHPTLAVPGTQGRMGRGARRTRP